MPSFCIGPKNFSSKSKAHKYVKSYLQNAIPSKIPNNDKKWVTSLLMMHPRYIEKSADAHEIIVMQSDYGENCFGFLKKKW